MLYYSGVHQPGSEFNVESWLLLFFVPASLFDLRLGPFALEFINRTPKVMSSRGIGFFWFNYETIWILSSAKDSILYKAKHVDSRVQSFPSWVELWTLYTYTQYQYRSKKKHTHNFHKSLKKIQKNQKNNTIATTNTNWKYHGDISPLHFKRTGGGLGYSRLSPNNSLTNPFLYFVSLKFSHRI